MSIGLHEKCLKRLREKLAELLPGVLVTNGMFLDGSAQEVLCELDTIIPQGEKKSQLEQFVSESPVSDFIYDTISKELSQRSHYDDSPDPVPITRLSGYLTGYEDPEAAADRLVREFESLPWQYTLTIKLDNAFGSLVANTFKKFTICDAMELLTPDENFIKEFTIPAPGKPDLGLGSLLAQLVPNARPTVSAWDKAAGYLQINTSGFIGFYSETAPLQEAISLLKAFCGIALATGLLREDYRPTYQPAPRNEMFIVHKRAGNSWILDREQFLGKDLSERLRNLAPVDVHPTIPMDKEWEEKFKGEVNESRLKRIGFVLTQGAKTEKILLACEWLFESYCGSNELLSFVQTVIAMEILLGDKATSDLMGVEQLLRNRCAYLIGSSQKDREKILRDFEEIYEVRCAVVHRGKSRLKQKERELFYHFRRLCHRVIQAEVTLLEKDGAEFARRRREERELTARLRSAAAAALISKGAPPA
jgi:hypothetical protein